MDLFKLLHRFVKFVLCFLALCQTKPSLSLTKISKVVEWVKVLNARCAFSNVSFVSPSFSFLLPILSLPSFSLLSLLSPLCTARPTAKCIFQTNPNYVQLPKCNQRAPNVCKWHFCRQWTPLLLSLLSQLGCKCCTMCHLDTRKSCRRKNRQSKLKISFW